MEKCYTWFGTSTVLGDRSRLRVIHMLHALLLRLVQVVADAM